MKHIFTSSIVFLLSLVFCSLPVITFTANLSNIHNSAQLHNKSIHLDHSFESRSSKKITYILSLSSTGDPIEDQSNLLTKLKSVVPFTLLHQYTHSCNAIAIEVSAYNAWALQSLPSNVNVFNAEQNVIPVRQLEVISINSKYEIKPSEYREMAFTGKNVKVGMIDTGIDLHHGDFSFSDTNLPKIVKGIDIADSDDDVQDLRIYPHGTHVGGIIAGNNPNLPIRKGVAPDASLLVYKVFGDNGSLNLEDIIKAIDLAVEDKCHVVNMSLGYSTVEEVIPSIDKDNPMYQAIEKASEEGVTVCAAAGNYGARTNERPWQILAPCIFDNTIGVAASDDRLCCTLACNEYKFEDSYSCNVQRLLYTPPFEDTIYGNNFLDCGYGSKEEINPVQTVAYAILHRGPETEPVPFLDKIRNVTNTNRFLGCIIVDENNNLNSTFSALEGSDTTTLPKERLLPTVIISKNLYEVVKNYMNEDSLIILRQSEKSVVSDFTCTGPCGDADYGSFKPDVCAPGKQISSAALSKRKGKDEYLDRYEIWEGTSMATACTSGVVALVKEAHPNWTPYQIKCALMNSADVLMNPQTNQPFSYFLQGSGQINAKHAINTPLLLSPPSHQRLIELDSSYQQTFTIKNMSNETIKATPSCSINTYFNHTFGTSELLHIHPVCVEFDQQEIELNPTDNKTIEVTFHTSSLLFQKPMMQGQLLFTLEYENESVEDRPTKLHIPFILHSESINPVHEGITNTHIIPSVQSYKTPSSLEFDLYSGTKLQYPTAYLLLNTAEQLRIYVTDKDNNPLGDIYYSEWVLPGDYSIRWDQKNLQGEYFLPNGEYKVYVEMNGRSYSRNAFGKTEIKSDPCTYLLDEITIQDSPIH